MEKLKYSKCPNCHKNGIKAFGNIGYRYNPIVECKYCNKKYSVNIALSIFMKIIVPVLTYVFTQIINQYLFKIPIWAMCIIAICGFFTFEYFAPLEEITESEDC